MTFGEKLSAAVAKSDSLLCIGLDPDIAKIPTSVRDKPDALFMFNKAIIDATANMVCCFKPNSAFYESSGADGIGQLKLTCDYIRENYREIPVLLDYKRGDIGNTNEHYARFAFEYLGVDAITIQPYLGSEANQAFLAHKDKGVFVLCRTSNPGAGEFQDVEVGGKKLYQVAAEMVAAEWNKNSNCHLVMGAPYPEELAWARKAMGEDMLFLVPGAGTQGGDLAKTVKAGINKRGTGIVINSSREVLYASAGEDFAEAAQAKATSIRNQINKHRR
ncbi:MAG TPA: orotidine-5'-phosphate decarboxylase [Candidatus Pristimantibacillus sp.]|jgi:orotidine-5'-phosphate decarboxylase|nr:orotidine-5'-phosphate decarboxylase [Candidatus Pristimantibacillus sp.]